MKTPPLLLGASLVFWAAQSGHWTAGLILATLIELPNVMDHRSNLSRADFDRVWDLCVVLFVGGAFYCYMTEEVLRVAFVFTEWTPVVFAPMALAQAYSTSPLLAVGVFSAFSWFRKDSGKPQEPRINTGFFYLAACLLAASASKPNHLWFYPIFSLLLGWCLWSFRPQRYAIPLWIALFCLIATAGYLGESRMGLVQGYFEGKFNDLFARFVRRLPDATESWTSIGAVGHRQDSSRIALRLSTKGAPPSLLREGTFNLYRSAVWLAQSREDDSAREVIGSNREAFAQVSPENANNSSWLLHTHQTNMATAVISTYLPGGKGILALPTGVFRLDDLPVNILETNRFAAVRVAEGPGLVSFAARYGPKIVLGPPPSPNDWRVPEEECPALDTVLARLGLRGKQLPEAMRVLQTYFATQFTYSTYSTPQPPGRDSNRRRKSPLARFLLETKTGHCEYFATTTTLLLRRLNYSARYVVGYFVEGNADSGGDYLVRERDAHAWCQVYMDGRWVDFDTTPGSWVEMERKRARLWEPLYDFASGLWFKFSQWRWLGSREGMLQLFWLFIPVIALMTWRIISAARQQKKNSRTSRALFAVARPGLDSEFYHLENRLAEFGLERAGQEAIRPWLERIRTRLPAGLPYALVKKASLLHYRYRFDPLGISLEERAALLEYVGDCLRMTK